MYSRSSRSGRARPRSGDRLNRGRFAKLRTLSLKAGAQGATLSNPAGIKGLGELANVDTAAAIANAVYHGTGQRIRELPICIEKLLTA
jgi:hypothetical protein